jgi:hypothetical protein
MMCFTFKTWTANSITDRQFMSVCTTRFATLRWTNTSPGGSDTISLAGTRLSEQPIQRYSGFCCSASRSKKCGSSAVTDAAHFRFPSSKSCNVRSRSSDNGMVLS